MAGLENIQSQPAFDPDSRYDTGDNTDQSEGGNDDERSMRLLGQLEDWFEQARIGQSENRRQQAIDADYFDHLQWDEVDRKTLEDRGQAPLVFNESQQACLWIIGTEQRMRVDRKVFPRSDDDVRSADLKTKVMKYVSDVNKMPFAQSRAFKDAVVAGVGWLDDGISRDPSEEPLYSRNESWRNVWYDHLSREPDQKDARFVFRARWYDLDLAIAMFPEHAAQLKKASTGTLATMQTDEDEFYYETALFYHTDAQGYPIGSRTTVDDALSVNNRRPRVWVIEAQYKMPCQCGVMYLNEHTDDPTVRGMHGVEFDKENADHVAAYDSGAVGVAQTMKMKVFYATFVKGTLMENVPSPFRHNRFTLTPVWAYRRDRDGAPYGAMRGMRDPQDDLNKRFSKAQYILATNRVIMEDGAVEDIEQLREEVADPAGIVVRKKGYELEINTDRDLAAEHVNLAMHDSEFIRKASGVTAENLGLQSNATSGKAIMARQDQGSIVTTMLFENKRFALQCQGEIQLSMIEQWYTLPKVLRITGDSGRTEWERINDPNLPESDITATQADFIIGEQDYRQSLRVAQMEQVANMVSQQPPEIAIKLMDLVFDLMDFPNKDEFVRRIREINGERDPSKEPTPEEQQADAQKQQQEQEDQQRQREAIDAQNDLTRAKAEQARGGTNLARAQAENTEMDTMAKAVDTAQATAVTPHLAPAAGQLVDAVDQRGAAGGLSQPQQPAPAQPAPQPQLPIQQ